MTTLTFKTTVLVFVCGSIFVLGGCVGNIATRNDVSEISAVTKQETRSLQKELSVLAERVENLEFRIEENQKRLDEFTAYLKKLNDKIDSKNSETFSRLSRQMAELQKKLNQDFQSLRRSINLKIDEINRALSSSRSTGTQSTTETGTYHVVEEGDSLWKIAQKYKSTTDAIRKANDIPADSDRITPGQQLFIPLK